MAIHSPVHSSIGTPSGGASPHAALGLLARQWFQDLFHSPHRGAFHRSLAVLVRYRSLQVLSLGEWSPQLPTAFHGRRRTREPPHPCCQLRLRASHPLWGRFPVAFPSPAVLRSEPPAAGSRWSHNPQRTSAAAHMHAPGLGSSAFARHYLRSTSLFLGVLRCFSSPGSRAPAYRFSGPRPPITGGGLPHSGILGSVPALRLPEAFRSAPRPSSACNAQASPSDAFSLTASFAVDRIFRAQRRRLSRTYAPYRRGRTPKVPADTRRRAHYYAGPSSLGAMRNLL